MNNDIIYNFFRRCLNRVIPLTMEQDIIVHIEEKYFHNYIGQDVIDQLHNKSMNVKKRFAVLYCFYMQSRILDENRFDTKQINKILTSYLIEDNKVNN